MQKNRLSPHYQHHNGDELLANFRFDQADSPFGVSLLNSSNIIELNAWNATQVDHILSHDRDSIVVVPDLTGLSHQYLQRLRDEGRTVLTPYLTDAGPDTGVHDVPYTGTALAAAVILLAVLTSIPIILMPDVGSVFVTMVKNHSDT